MATYKWSIPSANIINGTTYIKDTDNKIQANMDDLVNFVNSEGDYTGQGLMFDYVNKASAQTITGVKTFTNGLIGNVTGNLTGNSDTTTKLATARTIGGVSFDGTANINLAGVNTTGNQNTTGNAATATKLATPRNIALIGNVTGNANFDGSSNISINTSISSSSTITLTGDVSGSGTITNLGNVSISTEVANNSHSHDGTTLGMSQSLSANGYTVLPNGLIMQWGTRTGTTGNVTTNFPIAFPSACLNVTATGNYAGAAYADTITSYNKTSFTGWMQYTGGTWFAIGY